LGIITASCSALVTHRCFDFSFELLKFSISQPLWLFFASQGSLQQHATLGDRVDYLEKLMGDSADKHANEIGQAVDLRSCDAP
jgi:hypothetical protein